MHTSSQIIRFALEIQQHIRTACIYPSALLAQSCSLKPSCWQTVSLALENRRPDSTTAALPALKTGYVFCGQEYGPPSRSLGLRAFRWATLCLIELGEIDERLW
jgi:hypothetical protein